MRSSVRAARQRRVTGGQHLRGGRSLRRVPRSRTAVLPLLVALPALLVGGLGLLHPVLLEPDTAERWRLAHLLLLPAFPLVAGSVWFLLRGERGPAAWAARVAAFAYAVLYGALDAIAGIGAPHQVLRAEERGEPGSEPRRRLRDRRPARAPGVYALAAALLLTGGVLWLRGRSPYAVAGALVGAASCYPFLRHHVFPPRGVLAMAGIAAGLALLALSRQRESSAISSPGP
jgi:hypothetical protein